MDFAHARFAGEFQVHSRSFDQCGSRPERSAVVDEPTAEVYFRELSKAAVRACGVSGIDPKSVSLVISSYAVGGSVSKVRRFRLDDHAGMTSVAVQLAQEVGRNVYVGLHLMPATLSGQQRGALDDLVGMIGLAADLDRDKGNTFDIASFAIPPTVHVVSSRIPHRNEQPSWLFTKVVSLEDAKVMAWALARVVRDGDPATANISNVWRIPGTLNWPKPIKIKERGRPEAPQEVELLDGAIGEPVDPARFWCALEEALGVTDLRTAYEAARRRRAASEPPQARQSTPQPEEPRVYSRNDAAADEWDGTEHEQRRVAVALKHFKADCSMVDWLKTGHGLFTYAGSSWGREAWDAWSSGGSFCGVIYPGSAKFDCSTQETAWANFAKRGSDEAKAARGAKIGTVFYFARIYGGRAYFDAIKPFGKPPKAKLQHSDDVKAVLAAGAAIPTGKYRVMARIAHTKHLMLTSKSIMLCRMLAVVTDYLNREKRVGWAGFHRLANNMSYAEPCSVDNVRKLMRELQALGYIAMAAGTGINVVGKRGPTYTLVPPPGFTWESLIAWNRDMVGHDEQSAWDFEGLADNPSDAPVGDHIDNLVDQTPASSDNPSNVPPDDHIAGLSTRQCARGRPHPSTDGVSNRGEEGADDNPSDPVADAEVDPVPGTPEADRGLIRHWTEPNMLPPEARRLVDAMRTASMMAGGRPHWRHALNLAANVAKLLTELLTLGLQTDRLQRELCQHDLDFDGSREMRFRPKKPQVLAWKRKCGQMPDDVTLGAITYLASISDKLTAIANQLSRYAPKA